MKQSTIDGTALPPKSKKGLKFINSHASRFGLKIGSMNQETALAESVVCRFCLVFGKENADNATSKPRHLTRMHPAKWAEYQALTSAESQNEFFSTPCIPYVATMRAAFESEDAINIQISASIIETFIGELLFHPDDIEGVPHERAMAIFTVGEGHYSIDEKNPSRFRLCVRFMSRGASFRMAAALMNDTKEETGIGRYAGCTEALAARYARLVCAASLQALATHLAGVWMFSIALDSATNQARSYVDNWRCEHAAREAATYPVTRMWCGLYQLDLKPQDVFVSALSETYLGNLTGLIGYLRRQQNLITEMRSACPKVAATRWLSMYGVANWLCSNGCQIRAYLEDNAAPCRPNLVWWIFLYALRKLAREANAVFVSLQGRATLVQQQNDRFGGLVRRLCSMSGAKGPLTGSEIDTFPSDSHEIIGKFVISHELTFKYIEQLDLWVFNSLGSLDDAQAAFVTKAVGRMFVLAANSIHDLVERDQNSVVRPLVTPRKLVCTPMMAFVVLLNSRRDQLMPRFGEDGLHRIVDELKELSRAYDIDHSFRTAVEEFDDRLTDFDDIWSVGDAATKYPTFVEFCGGMATVFPNTSTVESDFSVIGCEKTDKRTVLTDLSLEGVLHCKQ